MYELKAEAFFDSAHFLTDYMGKCENLHGHRWRIEACIQAAQLQTSGTERDMVCDFGVFKQAIKSLAKDLDHTFLIEENSLAPKTISCLEEEGFTLKILPFRTTAENLAKYICEQLSSEGYNVAYIEVDETPNNRAIFKPNK